MHRPLLPIEAPQAKPVSNKNLVEAVLDAMRRRFGFRAVCVAANIEPVRGRFGRWSIRGFQAMHAALSKSP